MPPFVEEQVELPQIAAQPGARDVMCSRRQARLLQQLLRARVREGERQEAVAVERLAVAPLAFPHDLVDVPRKPSEDSFPAPSGAPMSLRAPLYEKPDGRFFGSQSLAARNFGTLRRAAAASFASLACASSFCASACVWASCSISSAWAPSREELEGLRLLLRGTDRTTPCAQEVSLRPVRDDDRAAAAFRVVIRPIIRPVISDRAAAVLRRRCRLLCRVHHRARLLHAGVDAPACRGQVLIEPRLHCEACVGCAGRDRDLVAKLLLLSARPLMRPRRAPRTSPGAHERCAAYVSTYRLCALSAAASALFAALMGASAAGAARHRRLHRRLRALQLGVERIECCVRGGLRASRCASRRRR